MPYGTLWALRVIFRIMGFSYFTTFSSASAESPSESRESYRPGKGRWDALIASTLKQFSCLDCFAMFFRLHTQPRARRTRRRARKSFLIHSLRSFTTRLQILIGFSNMSDERAQKNAKRKTFFCHLLRQLKTPTWNALSCNIDITPPPPLP